MTERRSTSITPVTIELREEHYAAEFALRLPMLSGAWDGNWKHPRAWRIDVAVYFRFRLPLWRLAGRELIVQDADRELEQVEYWEHWVLAGDRHQALGCLVRDLRRDDRAEWITHAAIYRVRPPLTADERLDLERCNGKLLLERARTAPIRPGRWGKLEMALA